MPEKDIAQLPAFLEPHRSTSAERGRLAREAWLRHFAPIVEFDAIIASCWAALHHGRPQESIFRSQQGRMIATSSAARHLRSVGRSAFLGTLKLLHLKSPYQLNER